MDRNHTVLDRGRPGSNGIGSVAVGSLSLLQSSSACSAIVELHRLANHYPLTGSPLWAFWAALCQESPSIDLFTINDSAGSVAPEG